MKNWLPVLLLSLFGLVSVEWEAARPGTVEALTTLAAPSTPKAARAPMDDSYVCPTDITLSFTDIDDEDQETPVNVPPTTCAKVVRLPVGYGYGPFNVSFSAGTPAPAFLPQTLTGVNSSSVYVALGRGQTVVTVTPTDPNFVNYTCTYSVTLIDNEAPALDVPSEVHVKSTTTMPDLRGLVLVEEDCDYTLTQSPAPGSPVSGSPVEVTFTATDANTQTALSIQVYFDATTPYDNLTLSVPPVCEAASLQATLGGLPPSECFTVRYRLNGILQNVGGCSDGNGQLTLDLGGMAATGANTFTVAYLQQDSQPVYVVNKTATATAGLPVLSTPTVSGAPVCAGQAVTLAFSVVNCPDQGTFTAQLSNASGSFTNPVSLGTISPGGAPVTIPAGTPGGAGYRIRVLRPGTDVTPAVSAPFQVNSLGSLAATTPTTPAKVCQGEALPVAVSTTGACPFPLENGFTVQLSSAVGSFANPTNLGTAPFTLPTNLPAGTGYRVRVVGGGQTSAASLPFRIEGPSLSVTPSLGGASVCRGTAVTVNFSLPVGSCAFPQGNQFTAQLSSATGSFNNPTNLGEVFASQANSVPIPASVAAGSGYRIRIVSSSPALTSSNSGLFQIRNCNNNRMSAEEPELVIAPNPVSSGEIRCRLSGMNSPVFSLTTIVGGSVNLSVKTDGGGEFVLTPQQPRAFGAGVYVLQASEGNQRLTRRVLVVD